MIRKEQTYARFVLYFSDDNLRRHPVYAARRLPSGTGSSPMQGRCQMRNVLVRIMDTGGRPVSGARVSFGTYGINSGVLPEKYTDSGGQAEFDIGEYGEICIYVNGQEKVGRGPIRGQYRIEM